MLKVKRFIYGRSEVSIWIGESSAERKFDLLTNSGNVVGYTYSLGFPLGGAAE